jgi:hypothetical protein
MAIYSLTENFRFPFHAEPAHDDIRGEVMREADGRVQTAKLVVARVKVK